MGPAEVSLSAPTPARARGRTALALLALTVAFTALCGLGFWQVERLAWKEALLQTIAERTRAAPMPLGAVERRWRETGDIEYMPVAAAGLFEHNKERHFFATWKGRSGFYIYTPLRLDDGRHLLVNRGFVPYELKDPATRAAGQVEGRVEVTGLAREPLAEKPSFIVPDNDEAKNIFYWKDRDRMAASVGLALGDENLVPFFVDAGEGAAPGGWPVGGVTIIDLPNSHLQYALTWFGLAGALVVVASAWFRRRSRGAA